MRHDELVSRKNGLRTALILFSIAAAFLVGFVIRHWQ
ncbi:MAG TPA: cytochrome oxidase small assembly protein [Burkholderiales bacterium]|nr:cytochrome oxidase small assembly protein [Burkholderiales bacterium]